MRRLTRPSNLLPQRSYAKRRKKLKLRLLLLKDLLEGLLQQKEKQRLLKNI
jgi:hypothetical protein